VLRGGESCLNGVGVDVSLEETVFKPLRVGMVRQIVVYEPSLVENDLLHAGKTFGNVEQFRYDWYDVVMLVQSSPMEGAHPIEMRFYDRNDFSCVLHLFAIHCLFAL